MSISAATAIALTLYLGLALLPGLALLRLAGLMIWPQHTRAEDGQARAEDHRYDPWLWLGLATGLGLALQPLIYLWLGVLGPLVGAGLLWSLMLLSSGYLIWAGRRDRISLPSTLNALRQPPALTMAALLTVLLAARWWALRDLSVPMFGDSLHHTMIVRLFSLQQGLPKDWRPFAELSTFSYHFGMHAGAASLASLSGLQAPRALIVTGQALMLIQALTAYALVSGLTGRRWAGLGAALAAGGLSTMPGYYANWGRYTQLAGQAVLPAALLLTAWAIGQPGATSDRGMASGRRGDRDRGSLVLAIVAVAGLALTHYIVTLLFALAVLALLASGNMDGWRERRSSSIRCTVIALGAILLTLPWIPRVLAGPLDESAIKLSTGRVADPDVYGVVSAWQIWNPDAVGRNLGWWLVTTLVAAAIVGLWHRDSVTRLGLVWAGLIGLATYPQTFGLPITGLLKDFTIAIGAYLPAALVIGGGLGALSLRLGLEAMPDRPPTSRPSQPWLLAATILLIAGIRGWQDRDLLDPTFQLVHPADEATMAWIRDKVPEDARFLVGSFSAFGDTVQAGDDAGWWLPLLAEPRRSTLPPITYGIERGFDPDYRLQVNALARLWQTDLDAPETRSGLREAGVSHAFAGVTGRQLDRAALEASPYWTAIHVEQGTAVYRFEDTGP